MAMTFEQYEYAQFEEEVTALVKEKFPNMNIRMPDLMPYWEELGDGDIDWIVDDIVFDIEEEIAKKIADTFLR